MQEIALILKESSLFLWENRLLKGKLRVDAKNKSNYESPPLYGICEYILKSFLPWII